MSNLVKKLRDKLIKLLIGQIFKYLYKDLGDSSVLYSMLSASKSKRENRTLGIE